MRYLFIILSLFILFSITNCRQNNKMEIDETNYFYDRLINQANIKELKCLNGTFWVPFIPDTSIFPNNECFAFFDDYVVMIWMWAEDIFQDFPITSINRYKFNFYKILWIDKYALINDNQINLCYETISLSMHDQYLYITFNFNMDDSYTVKYQLHSMFDTIPDWNEIS